MNRPGDYQTEFLKTFIHLLKVAHMKLKRSITKNRAPLDRSAQGIDLAEKQIIKDFCSIWTHPHISTLSGDNGLTMPISKGGTQDPT